MGDVVPVGERVVAGTDVIGSGLVVVVLLAVQNVFVV